MMDSKIMTTNWTMITRATTMSRTRESRKTMEKMIIKIKRAKRKR